MISIRIFQRRAALAIPILLLACVVAITVSGRLAFGTPGSGVAVNTIVKAAFEEMDAKTHFEGHKAEIRTKGYSDVYVLSVTLAPGGQFGWHSHPGPSVVSVKSGTVTYYHAEQHGCVARTYPAGTGFVDPGGSHVHNIRNEGSEPVELIGFQILPAGVSGRIDAPSPATCSF
jgi:quercetin dioxygenase-like cupin family protein